MESTAKNASAQGYFDHLDGFTSSWASVVSATCCTNGQAVAELGSNRSQRTVKPPHYDHRVAKAVASCDKQSLLCKCAQAVAR